MPAGSSTYDWELVGRRSLGAGFAVSSGLPTGWSQNLAKWIQPHGRPPAPAPSQGMLSRGSRFWGLQVGRFRTAHPHASSNYLSQTPNSLAPGRESHTPKCLPIGCCRGFVTLDSFIGWKVASAQDWLFIEIEWRGGGPAVPSPLLPAPFHPLPGPVALKLRGEKKEFRRSASN